MASRCTTAFVDPPTAASATIALWNDARVMTEEMVRPCCTSSTASRPDSCAPSSSRLSGAGVPASPGIVMPSASAMMLMLDAVPMVLQWPRLRIIDDSDRRNSSADRVPARTSSLRRQTSVPQPRACPRKVPFSIGPPEITTAGRSTTGRRHQQRRDRLVAAAEQHEPVDRVGAEHLLHRHRGHVPPQHGGRPDQRLPERDDRQVERDAARLAHPPLDGLAPPRSGARCRRQVGCGVGDRDLRAAVEGARRERRAASTPGGCSALRSSPAYHSALRNRPIHVPSVAHRVRLRQRRPPIGAGGRRTVVKPTSHRRLLVTGVSSHLYGVSES